MQCAFTTLMAVWRQATNACAAWSGMVHICQAEPVYAEGPIHDPHRRVNGGQVLKSRQIRLCVKVSCDMHSPPGGALAPGAS